MNNKDLWVIITAPKTKTFPEAELVGHYDCLEEAEKKVKLLFL